MHVRKRLSVNEASSSSDNVHFFRHSMPDGQSWIVCLTIDSILCLHGAHFFRDDTLNGSNQIVHTSIECAFCMALNRTTPKVSIALLTRTNPTPYELS
jgi:hypothetical protein